jgi:hypothetical protein
MVSPQFSRYVVGFKQEESDYLLNFLYDHIAKVGGSELCDDWLDWMLKGFI